nr:VOC family protein [Chromobacterium sp. ASV5]
MKLGYTIVYVPDVAASLRFFGEAFGLAQRFIDESGQYGELETGDTTLSFACHALAESNLPAGYVRASDAKQPLGMEIGLVCDDVPAAHARALGCGARELAAPTRKPWGQTVSYLQSPDGTLIELCSPHAV